MTSRLLTLACLWLAAAVPADAFQSECYLAGTTTRCAEGPQAARERWIGPGDEHRAIWSRTAGLARIPAEVNDLDFQLETFTGPEDVDVAGQSVPSVRPVNFIQATRTRTRTMTVAELAQLPDFAYALWDWVLGNETCPLNADLDEEADPAGCHAFKTHMGAVNSNHFLPQARRFFAAYHELALGRAADCAVMASRLDVVGAQGRPEFAPFLRACEVEALVLESIAHHFLQDAWSTGHMWERWGSPDLVDFLNRADAILVAMTSGLIHGAKAVLQEQVDFAKFDVNDALCFPQPEVLWTLGPQQAPVGGVGDLFLDRLETGFTEQFHQAYSCLTSAMREVYLASGQQHGTAGELDPSLEARDALSDACFTQRATNGAMRRGAGVDFVTGGGTQRHLPLEPVIAGRLLPVVSTFLGRNVNPIDIARRSSQYRKDLARISFTLFVRSVITPDGTQAASGGLGTLVGIEPNGSFADNEPPARYLDPPLPWPAPGHFTETSSADLPDAGDRALFLARAFHRAHALDWCNAFRDGSPDSLDVQALRQRVQALAGGGSPAELEAACAVCVEFAQRHLRVGDANDYDTTREPLCFFLADGGNAQFVFQDGTPSDSIATLAAQFCGCEPPTPTTTTTTLPPIVHISGFAFVPSSLGVGVNAMVQWVNDDFVPHSVVADNASFSSAVLSKNDTFTRTFNTAGSVGYHCGQHASETGTIVVGP